MIDPLKTYDYLTLARQRILAWVRPLSPEQYTKQFPIGLGSLARTLTHIMTSEWYYMERMQGHAIAPDEQWPIRDEAPPPFATLEAAWIDLARRTRAALSEVRDWKADLVYGIDGDKGPEIITASASDIFTQLVLHEVHHRAQAMNMLRHLGFAAEDIDFNTMMYKRRPA
jgi:uncharacterized damage-inducible protein DinB